ncbi:desmoglein-2-like protein [Myxocyprinus asiaticus]|uniref:desmoglein-2-like protein n=1 Tax=Myxocyprinus asiaticus TaxID=70543 RepID=UPI0022214BEF|nr:desmoglein-2-like protein [Myxocyprinus asiaticus]
MEKIRLIALYIVLMTAALDAEASAGPQHKVRQKREWIIPPRKLKENVNYMDLEYIAKIRSDEETRTTIRYSLTGPGADRDPVNLFTVGREDGLVKIHGVLDREKTPTYHLRGVAKFLNGSYAEKDIDLRIVVLDENDCPPVFNIQLSGAIHELSAQDTFVITITATDADEPGTLHSKIAYSIVEQSHANMFYINRETGGIYVKYNSLDREKQDTYTLTIKGTDMHGAPNGKTGMGKVVISILDVNDNIPTLEKNSYECSVEENTKNVEVVRIQAIDADLIHTDNWLAVFSIISGNEGGYFFITTDVNTNEGILMLIKEVDYEELKQINLMVSVSNKAEYHSSVIITERTFYPIRVSVINQPEGPRFKPAIKVITISEDKTSIDITKVINNYVAIDSDTLQIATNVMYAKGQDIDNWLRVDAHTADIRLNKIPDYESKFVINGTYSAQIICITKDYPAKTATGTIAIQVEDFNDHCPILSSASQTLCYKEHVLYITAVDRDHFPNAAPFEFKVNTKSTLQSWSVEHLNDTTAILRSHEMLWPGQYRVFVEVRDQQGKFCAGQVLQVDVCTCDVTKVCLRERETRFGASGVLLMLLGLLLLLLVPLLLIFCLCGGMATAADFKSIPFDAKEHLIVYNTEGQGEDKEMALLKMYKEPDHLKHSKVDTVTGAQKWTDGVDGAAGALDSHRSSFYWYDLHGKTYHHAHQQNGKYIYTQGKDEHMKGSFEGHNAYEGLTLSDDFLASYYSQKASYVSKKHDLEDCLRVYDYEGEEESCMGSFEDICSLMHEGDNLAFLNDLDLKFKTLAEICSGSIMETEISSSLQVTSKPVLPTTHIDVSKQGAVSKVHSQETVSSSIIHASGAKQASGVSSSGVYIQEKVVVPNTNLLVQQPALYYTTTAPVYVLDSHPALVVNATPVLGIEESMLLEGQNSNAAQCSATKHEMKQYQSVVFVERQQTTGSVQAQGGVLGALQIESENMQSTEAHGIGRTLYPTSRVMSAGLQDRK